MKPISYGRQGIVRLIRVVSIASLTIMPSKGHAQDNSKALAEELVPSSGIKAGLCVHLGCRDGALAAELAGTGSFLVHGLDKDPVMVRKARRSLQGQDQGGRLREVSQEPVWSCLRQEALVSK